MNVSVFDSQTDRQYNYLYGILATWGKILDPT